MAGRSSSNRTRMAAVCAAVITIGVGSIAVAQSSKPSLTTVSEASLRNIVVNPVKPSYPAASLRAGISGVAVARVIFGTNGHAKQVDVTQAPDEAIAQALRQAVMTWTIKPGQTGGNHQAPTIHSTLTFYFQISNGEGVVSNPNEMRRIVRPAGKRRPSGGPSAVKQIDAEDLKTFVV